MLETENEELRSRISEMLNERTTTSLATPIDLAAAAAGAKAMRQNVPTLNFATQGGVI